MTLCTLARALAVVGAGRVTWCELELELVCGIKLSRRSSESPAHGRRHRGADPTENGDRGATSQWRPAHPLAWLTREAQPAAHQIRLTACCALLDHARKADLAIMKGGWAVCILPFHPPRPVP